MQAALFHLSGVYAIPGMIRETVSATGSLNLPVEVLQQQINRSGQQSCRSEQVFVNHSMIILCY